MTPKPVKRRIDWSDGDAGIPDTWRARMVAMEEKVEAAWEAITELQQALDERDD